MQLRGADGQGHRQAAAEQDDGVDAPQPEVEVPAGQRERVRRECPVDRVGRDQAAEEHHLGGQEHPHPEGRRVLLLLQVVELGREDRLASRRQSRRSSMAPWASSASSGE